MGIITLLKSKLGEDKTSKLLAIVGGLFIFLVGNFPLSEIVQSGNFDPAVSGYIILAWSAFVIAFSSIVILFFGKSEMFPPTGTAGTAMIIEEAIEDVVAIADNAVDEIVEVIDDVVEVIDDIVSPEPEEPIQ